MTPRLSQDDKLMKNLKELRDTHDIVLPDRGVVSTGSLMLDWAIGRGGIPPGTLIDIFGREAIGKTTMVLSVMGERTKYQEHCAFIDVEHRINPDLVEIVVPGAGGST